MRRLTLLRHAHASEAPAGGEDFDRPLNAQGDEAARTAARHLRASLAPPSRLLASPSLRTRRTGEIVRELAFPATPLEFSAALYLGGPDELLLAVGSTPADCAHLLLIGHNPGLSDLCARLSHDPAFEGFAPAGWASLLLPIDAWTGVTALGRGG